MSPWALISALRKWTEGLESISISRHTSPQWSPLKLAEIQLVSISATNSKAKWAALILGPGKRDPLGRGQRIVPDMWTLALCLMENAKNKTLLLALISGILQFLIHGDKWISAWSSSEWRGGGISNSLECRIQPYKGNIISPILQIRKQRSGKIRPHIQSPKVSKRRSRAPSRICGAVCLRLAVGKGVGAKASPRFLSGLTGTQCSFHYNHSILLLLSLFLYSFLYF